MIISRFSKSAFSYILGSQLPKLAGLIIMPFISENLSKSDFGIIGLVTTVGYAAGAFTTLGLDVILANELSKNEKSFKNIWSEVYGLLIVWSFPFALIVSSVFAMILPDNLSGKEFWLHLIVILSPIVFLNTSKTMGVVYFQFKERAKQIALRNTVFGVFNIVLTFVFVALLDLSYFGWLLALALTSSVHNFSYFLFVMLRMGIRPRLRLGLQEYKRMLTISLPVIPHYFGNYILESSDQLIMKTSRVSLDDIGGYHIASIMGGYIKQLGMSIGKALTPIIYSEQKLDSKSHLKALILCVQVFMIVVAFNLSLWIKEIIMLLFRVEKISDVYSVAVLIVMAYSYRPLYSLYSSLEFYREDTISITKWTIFMGSLNIIMNILLIPIYGYGVAALTTYISYLILGVVPLSLKKEYRILALTGAVLILVSTTIAFVLIDVSLYLRMATSAISFTSLALTYFVFYKFTK